MTCCQEWCFRQTPKRLTSLAAMVNFATQMNCALRGAAPRVNAVRVPAPTFISGRGQEDAMRIFKRQTVTVNSFLFAVLVLLCVSSHWYPVTAQTLTTGQVLGQVTDPVGAAVARAQIDLRNSATGTVRTATTDQEGYYTFAQVTTGVYAVTVTASGCAKMLLPSVTVEVGKSSAINVTLKLGSITEVVGARCAPGAELHTRDATGGNTRPAEELHPRPT